jgi:hypothetical protein
MVRSIFTSGDVVAEKPQFFSLADTRAFFDKCYESDYDIRQEYDLTSMQVRRMGEDRKGSAGHMVRLNDDVAEMFPSAEAVNEVNQDLAAQ